MKLRTGLLALGVIISSLFLAGCTLTQPKVGGLQAISAGSPYSVFINGQFLETAPFIQRSLAEGEYNIRLEPTQANLASYETTIHVRDKLLTVITWKPGASPEQSGGVIYEMEPISTKNKSVVEFISIPDGAIISLPNRDKQFAPLSLTDLATGEHEYEVTLPSYETQKNTLNIVAGYKTTVTVKLAKITDFTQMPDSSKENQDLSPTPAAATVSSTISPTSAKVTPTRNATPTPSPTTTQSARDRQLQGTHPIASPSAAANQSVLILKTGLVVNGTEVLRVREKPSTSATEIGQAPVGQKYPYGGEQKEGWYKIIFNNATGWVNGAYAQLQ